MQSLIEIHVYDRNHFDQLCSYLEQNNIPYKKTKWLDFRPSVYISKDYILEVGEYLNANNIGSNQSNGNPIALDFIKEHKFDDLTYLYQNKLLHMSPHKILIKLCYESDLDAIDYVLTLDPKLSINGAMNIISWREGDRDDIAQSLLEYDAEKDPSRAKSWMSKLPLSNACEQGNFKIVKLLVKYGAKPRDNDCAIELALDYNHVAIAKFLIKKGGYINNYNPKTFSFHMSKREDMRPLIKFFATTFDDDSISLLEKMDLPDALKQACKKGLLKNIKALVNSGIDIKFNKTKLLNSCRHRPKIYSYVKSLNNKNFQIATTKYTCK